MRYLAVALLALACLGGCSAQQRVDIKIVNATPYPLTITAKTLIFQRTFSLPPGSVWSGSVDRRLVGAKAEVVVK